MKKENRKILNGITYRAVIRNLPFIKKVIYNFGTESFVNTRTKEHARTIKRLYGEYGASYTVLSEKEDRVVGNRTIAAAHDTDYIKYLRDYINERSEEKVKLLSDSDLDIEVSKTECLLLSEQLLQSDLFKEAISAADKWYYNDKTLRIPHKYANGSSIAYSKLTLKGQEKACRPLYWGKHARIIEKVRALNNKDTVKHVAIQSLSLASDYELLKLFPTITEITVIVTADDNLKNEELYQKMSINPLYNIIELDNDEAIEDYYMNTCKEFDLVIMNPPYTRSIAGPILREVIPNNTNCIVLMLSSLTTSLGKGDPATRKATAKYLTNIEPLGAFSDEVPYTVSLYTYTRNDHDLHTYEEFSTYPAVEESIRRKVAPLPKFQREWMKEDLSRRCKELHPDWGSQYTWSERKTKFVEEKLKEGEVFIECGALGARNGGEGIIVKTPHPYVASYYGPKELVENFKNPIYKYLAHMLSTNGRDQQVATISQLPLALPDFTEEEINYMKNLPYGISK